jgi:hypothetical protein
MTKGKPVSEDLHWAIVHMACLVNLDSLFVYITIGLTNGRHIHCFMIVAKGLTALR